jgi:CDP-diacylglycerol---glycerol-3-phosphate 3-phosphatidyltransferase
MSTAPASFVPGSPHMLFSPVPLEAASARGSIARCLSSELLTWANLVTAARLVGGLAAFGAFYLASWEGWNFIGLAIYWAGDILDGWLARRLKQETLFGAQFDILADRMLICLFYLGYLTVHPIRAPAVLLFLFEFAVLDHYLSNQFMRWPIVSPNYFYLVDRQTWMWLWSTPAKALNTGLVTALLIALPSQWPAILATISLISVRLWCVRRTLLLATRTGRSQAAAPAA